MSAPIPVILCGKIPSHQAAVPNALKPEYKGMRDLVIFLSKSLTLTKSTRKVLQEVFPTVESFAAAFPALFGSSSEKPVAVFMGGGFDRVEFETAYALPGASSIPWLRPTRTKPGNEHMLLEGNPPSAEKVASLARNALDEHLKTIMAGEGAGLIWYY